MNIYMCVNVDVFLARAVRRRLKNDCNIQGGITLVLSTEKPVAGKAIEMEMYSRFIRLGITQFMTGRKQGWSARRMRICSSFPGFACERSLYWYGGRRHVYGVVIACLRVCHVALLIFPLVFLHAGPDPGHLRHGHGLHVPQRPRRD